MTNSEKKENTVEKVFFIFTLVVAPSQSEKNCVRTRRKKKRNKKTEKRSNYNPKNAVFMSIA